MQLMTMMRSVVRIDGEIVPKARPRVTRRGITYMPSKYTEWKDATICALQANMRPITSPVGITINLYGKHSRKGDLDNIAGAVLDAMVQGGILPDDNLTWVKQLSTSIQWGKKVEPYYEISVETLS
jgi:Holliday junction resolvase RusA-like endonuclease